MRMIAYIALVIVSICTILLLPVATSLVVFDSLIGKPYQSIDYLENHDVYKQFNQDLRQQLKNIIREHPSWNQPKVVQIVDRASTTFLSDAMLTDTMEQLQTHLWDYFTDKTNEPQAVSLTHFKDAFYSFINETNLSDGIKRNIYSTAQDALPDAVTLTMIMDRNNEQLAQLKQQYFQYRTSLWMVTIGSIVLLVVLILLSWKMKVARIWLFITFMLIGLLHHIIWIGYALAKHTIDDALIDRGVDKDFAILQLLIELMREISSWVSVVGGLFIISALLIWFLPKFIKKHHHHQPTSI